MLTTAMIRPLTVVLFTAWMLVPAMAPAQQAEEFGDYIAHYNALNTNLLPPEVASAFGIQRSSNRALLNVAVLRRGDGEADSAVAAVVEASARNLTGQRRDIEMTEMRDGDAIYYIGTFRVHREETMDFSIRIQPEGASRAHEFTFRQQFFTD